MTDNQFNLSENVRTWRLTSKRHSCLLVSDPLPSNYRPGKDRTLTATPLPLLMG